MPFPVLPIAGGLALAKWGPAAWNRVKALFTGRSDLDPGLSDLQKKDVQNLLQNVSDALTLKGAIAYYQAQGFTISAQALCAKLAATKG